MNENEKELIRTLEKIILITDSVPFEERDPESPGVPERIVNSDVAIALAGLAGKALSLTHNQRIGNKDNYSLGRALGVGADYSREDLIAKQSYYNQYRRYLGDAPIFGLAHNVDRYDTKIKSKFSNDFFSEIVNQKASFIFGKPAIYQAVDPADQDALNLFYEANDLSSFDSDIATTAGICGVAYRFFKPAGETLIGKEISPWLVVHRELDDEATISIIHEVGATEEWAHIYSGSDYYKVSLKDGDAIASYRFNILQAHPVVEYRNNPEGLSHCSKVLDMIDAYDMISTSTASELAQMRLAYLVISGGEMFNHDEARQFSDALKKTGTIHLAPGASGSFLSKSLDMTSVTTFLDMLEQSIYRFTNAVKYDKEQGNLSGTALSLRLQAIQISSSQTWHQFSFANDKMFGLLRRFHDISSGRQLGAITQQVRYNIPVDSDMAISKAEGMDRLGIPAKYWLRELGIWETQEEIDEVALEMEERGYVSDAELSEEENE